MCNSIWGNELAEAKRLRQIATENAKKALEDAFRDSINKVVRDTIEDALNSPHVATNIHPRCDKRILAKLEGLCILAAQCSAEKNGIVNNKDILPTWIRRLTDEYIETGMIQEEDLIMCNDIHKECVEYLNGKIKKAT